MSHIYEHKGRELRSVTTIISDCEDKPQLLPWAAKQVCEWIKARCESPSFGGYLVSEKDLFEAGKNFREVSESALNIGSAVHNGIEYWLRTGKEIDISDLDLNRLEKEKVLHGFVAFLEFYEEHSMQAIEVEEKVYGDTWAGMLDYYGWFRPDRDSERLIWTLDWKASKGHYKNSHGPQAAAYASCRPKCEGRCGVVRLDKETGYPDFKDYTDKYELYLYQFHLMKDLYYSRRPRVAKKAGWEPKYYGLTEKSNRVFKSS